MTDNAQADNANTPLTAEGIRAMMDEMQQYFYEVESPRRVEQAKAGAALMEATPEHLRGDPFIVHLATAIANGAIFHPKDAAAFKAEWERLCREE